ncbi:hypothetical protein EK21DRAFT_91338 [Setomelanomma holmii]|uniref:Uncharacterized protein n=1 Tax=Setomelanomma holmii TaxID=210430 RepID=A0A9P4H3Q9_9PLEO|nr:hypothetical protein EK21DRAFT_91338 [Setomelanomma holmii]
MNHLPARGDSRTALEAAVEWNRLDMMSFLVSCRVNIGLIVDKEGTTQYERALAFSEKKGEIRWKQSSVIRKYLFHVDFSKTVQTSCLLLAGSTIIWKSCVISALHAASLEFILTYFLELFLPQQPPHIPPRAPLDQAKIDHEKDYSSDYENADNVVVFQIDFEFHG